MSFAAPPTSLIPQVAKRLRQLRQARRWTLEQCADRLGMAVQNYARIERGQNLTLQSLERLAALFEVSPDVLLQAESRHVLELAKLFSMGWRVLHGVDAHGAGAVPAYDLKASAGPGLEHGAVQALAWLRPPAGRHAGVEGLFLAQVSGSSMEPLAPDGAWCLFRTPVRPPLVRKVVLLQLRDSADEETGGGYLLKRIGAVEMLDANTGALRLRLDSVAKDFAPRYLTVRDEAELQAVGELVEVLASQ